MMKQISIDTKTIIDWRTFHNVFSVTFGFPDFYGQNMDAWIDCMTYLDDPTAQMTTIHVEPGKVLELELSDSVDFAKRCPDIFNSIESAVEFVNYRRTEQGSLAVITLSCK